MRNWTESIPGRLEAEVEAFNEPEGLDFELDRQTLETTGHVVFRGALIREGKDAVDLEVRYPESFPYLRPEVFAPNLHLHRHQNPYRHNLCLLDRSSRHWSPSLTGAWLVSERVSLLLDLIESGDPAVMRAEEAPQGEPASTYFSAAAGAVVFIPEAMLHLSHEIRAGLARISVGPPEPKGSLVRGCLSGIATRDRKGRRTPVAKLEEPLAQRFPIEAYEIRWVRLDAFPSDGPGSPDALLEAARSAPGFAEPPLQHVDDRELRIVGVVCHEEVRQGEYEDAWLFVVDVRLPDGHEGRYVARGERLSSVDLGERIPSIRGLDEKTVALAGLGALGGPIAAELARAQLGELRLLDHDHVEASTIVRWPRGLTAVGWQKTSVLGDWFMAEYPFTRLRSFSHRVGVVPATGEELERSEADVMTDFFEGADMLLDATAELGVQQFLAALADEAGMPQVYVWATEGGWGGAVARIVPGETGCWYCLQLHFNDGTIPTPPFAETGRVQPRGCTEPTWIGTSFDALSLIAQAVRTTCFTLVAGRTAERDGPNDVFICDQPAEHAGVLAAPVWSAYTLERHKECFCFGAANAA